MRPEEIERFFARAGRSAPEALAMAVHVAATDRLIGTCAFSQLDGDNGSALFHITIGEADAWGQGYGTEATQLMLDHAFGTLGLHRIALFVFEFNERADPRLPALRVRRRGPRARVDLARRPLVGRAGDERARVRLAQAPRATEAVDADAGDDGAPTDEPAIGRAGRGRRVGPAATDDREVAMTTTGRPPTRRGPRSAS